MQGRSLEELLAAIEAHEGSTDLLASELQDALQHDPSALTGSLFKEEHEQDEEKGDGDIRTKILTMKIKDKIKLAMFGNSTCRALLILDANKMIQQFVLKNPKLSAREVEEFMKNPNLPEAVIRGIADRKEWMKSYPLKLAIVKNPRTPPDLALKWVRHLNIADLRGLGKSKNIPQVVAVAAKKMAAESTEKK